MPSQSDDQASNPLPEDHSPRQTDQPLSAAEDPDVNSARGHAFPIVGIGASAGGLEAVTQLLRALPGDTGMAYVVVQHLDPDHKSQLSELLAAVTPIRVHTVEDGMHIQPNQVFVIPPNVSMVFEDGSLRLARRKSGLHLPIDTFFESLARGQGSKAIGIVLSGTGSDGSQGIRNIKEECGITFAQDEASARHSGMPHNAVATGAVDFVLPPAKIAEELLRLAKNPYVVHQGETPHEEILPDGDGELKKIFKLLQNHTKVDFSHYKQLPMRRRLGRRMLVLRLGELPEYRRYIEEHPSELRELYNDLLISVTNFFRDPEAFEALKPLLGKYLMHRKSNQAVRVWVPGCATGEEVYTLAMCIYELLQDLQLPAAMQLFGTDINEPALEHARAGLYSDVIAQDVSAERLRRFFVHSETGYQISKPIRESCVFARQDLTHDPPFSHMDLISCRNVLIYMDTALQRRILPVFHYSLNPDGLLLLGSAESANAQPDLFDTADKQNHIYSRKSAASRFTLELALGHPGFEPALPAKTQATLSGVELQRKTDRIIQTKYSPAAVVVDAQLQILHFRGHTSMFLEPTPGEASLNLLRMAREGLVLPLRKLLQAVTEQNSSLGERAQFVDPSGQRRQVEIEVTPITGPAPGERYFLVVFEEEHKKPGGPGVVDLSAPVPAAEKRLGATEYTAQLEDQGRQLQQQLAEAREYLRSLSEDHEAHSEELRAANEELQSTNEELQSTNEELSTTKEELQSSNEELTTVNEELQNRNQEINAVNNDLKNLLSAVQIPILMLDNTLRLRRFNSAAEKLLELTPADMARPISRLRGGLEVPQLEQLAHRVIETLKVERHEVQDREGRWHSVNIRPYRTLDDRIDGVVIAIVDIDALKRTLLTAEQARDYAEAMIEVVREPLLVLDADMRVLRATPAFYDSFHVSRTETEGRFFYDLGNGQWNQPRLRELLGNALFRDVSFQDFEVQHNFEHLGQRTFRLNGRRLPHPESRRVLVSMEDLSKRREEAEIRYRRLFETAKEGMLVLDDETETILDINPFLSELTGFPREAFIGKRLDGVSPFLKSKPLQRVIADSRIMEVVNFSTVLQASDGRDLDTDIVANKYTIGTRHIIQINIRDVTKKTRAEAALRETQDDLRLFVENVREYAMFQVDPFGKITSWNRGAQRVWGYTEEEIVGQPVARLFTPEDAEKGEPLRARERASAEGSATYERWHVRKDGTRFFAHEVLTAIRDQAGRLRGFAKVMRDATAERQSEEQIRRSLKEKDILLKEIHHRVKNNLQVISSLIQLQSDYLRDPGTLLALDEMHNRVRSIAAIHEMLYGTADVSQVDFAQYLQKIAKDLFSFYQARPEEVRLRTDIADCQLELGQAVPCGLIVNELLSNSLKHAFPDRRPGLVQITLRADGEKCTLSVGDNGRGLPPDLDPMHATSMGLQLVRLLVEQLQGTLQLDRSQGVRFTITFPFKMGHSGTFEPK